MITIDNVTKTYMLSKKVPVLALQGVSMKVEKGEFLVITGRSGSGKTTLLNLVGGLTRPGSGKVLLDGVAVWELPDKEQAALRNQKIGFIFQFPSLMPSLTTLENVLLPTVFSGSQGKHGDRQRAIDLLEEIGLADKLEAFPRQLSGGQQQRVVIARSLINQPDLLLADEPTSDLDEQTELEIMTLFREIHSRTGVTILLVTHSRELVSFGTRGMHMASGKILAGIPAAAPLEAPAVFTEPSRIRRPE